MRFTSWLSALGLAALALGKSDTSNEDTEVKSIAVSWHATERKNRSWDAC